MKKSYGYQSLEAGVKEKEIKRKSKRMVASVDINKHEGSYHFEIYPKGQQWHIKDNNSSAGSSRQARKQAKIICKRLGIKIDRIINRWDFDSITFLDN